MRTLLEIIEAAKDGHRPTADECYFAMLALEALHTFTAMDLRALAAKSPDNAMVRWRVEEDFNRTKRALNVPPDEWLGPGSTPGTPEQQQRRRVAKAVLAKAVKAVKSQ